MKPQLQATKEIGSKEFDSKEILDLTKKYNQAKKSVAKQELHNVDPKTDFKTISKVLEILEDMQNEDGESIAEIVYNMQKYSSDELNDILNLFVKMYKKKVHEIIVLMFGEPEFLKERESVLFLALVPLFSVFANIKAGNGKQIETYEKVCKWGLPELD